jgi:hypothetical protein
VACWLAAEAVASVASSASCYDRVENIRVVPIVEPECKFIEIEWQIFLAKRLRAAFLSAGGGRTWTVFLARASVSVNFA